MILLNPKFQWAVLILMFITLIGSTYVAGRVDQKSKMQAEYVTNQLRGIEKHEATKRAVRRMAVPELDSVLDNWM